MDDQRKSVLITGCSKGGIGYALARAFNSKGFRVFATARNAQSISDLQECGIETLSLEVHKPESIRNLKTQMEHLTGGKLDFLVNNAGRNYTVPALDVDFEEVRETFEVNLFAVMRICQEFAPLLIRSKGTIVQIGSIAGVMPYVFGSAYNASKAALHAYSNTLRVELAPFDVGVLVIVTGGVQSRIARVDRALPDDSIYMPINAEYQRRLKYSQEGAMSNEAYAESVVIKVTKPRPSFWIWEGNKSWAAWFMDTFLPKSWMDLIFIRMFNLWKLKGYSSDQKEL